MLAKRLWFPALLAFSMAVPATVARAQDMGGEKKDDDGDKGEKKDEPKADPGKDDKKPDQPKGKTLAFDAKPDSFKDEKNPAHGFMKRIFKLAPVEGEQDAVVVVGYTQKADYAKEKEHWVSRFEDKDGKKLDPATLKDEPFEANGVKGKIAEVAGNFSGGGPHKGKKGDDKGAEKPAEKKWTKVINVFLEGPDGGWVVRIQGGEKTVDKYKDDFMKFVKSVKIADKTGDDKPMKKNKKDKGGDD